MSKQYYPWEVFFNETRGGLAIKYGTDDYWTPEELTAMMLTYIKEITTAYSEKEKGKRVGAPMRRCKTASKLHVSIFGIFERLDDQFRL